MRKLTVSYMMSLDGFTSGPDGEFVAPPWSDQVAEQWSRWAMRSNSLFVYGRVNFEYQKAFWMAAETDEAMPQDTRDFAVAYNRAPRMVVSRTLTGNPGWNGEVLPGLDSLAALKASPGQDILCFGGADLIHGLADADLIDTYRLMIPPYTLGGGKRLFEGGPRRDFALTETLTTDVGSLILTYARTR